MFSASPPLPAETEATMIRVLDCAFAVHRELGPGFKEAIYGKALRLELEVQGIRFESEKPIEVKYRSWLIPGQRLDLLVEGSVIVEIKAVKKLKLLHRRQIVSYLRSLGLRAGLLLNFDRPYLREGIRRIVL